MKPEIHEEAIGRSTHEAFRGERGQRAGTEQIGTWETRQVGEWRHSPFVWQESITAGGDLGRESERPIVAKKSGNAEGAKGPCWKQATARGKENRLEEETPTTEERRRGGDAGLSGKVSLPRQKLGHKAKQNVSPSEAALKRERAKLHAMTDRHQCFKPLPTLISELNRHLKGWQNYFRFGYPRQAFREINSYVRSRLTQHVKRRSQRPFRPPKGTTYYHHFQKMGLMEL